MGSYERAVPIGTKNAFLKYGGTNPIKNVADDTVTNWVALGSGLYFFDTDGQVINKPDDYGWVFNIVSPDLEIRQMWFGRPTERVYHRGGNRDGFHSQWTQFVDINGGEFAGTVTANSTNRAGSVIRNISVRNDAGTEQTTDRILAIRK